ncbi:hypothetical protein [Shewanella sp. 10N.286.48.B5]|uniref:hypothetical protein n=1 Tax=Shewanella sp. 10N.286.48.B5 TaxID=1880834 RepID=UPI000C81E9AA|nr:hypothetical protein [Shewanella sp. 10N.286.48.B5]PMH85661.1 hypothetical protein BCU57_13645 [Shewanella sp. 10N.286.48.B5]
MSKQSQTSSNNKYSDFAELEHLKAEHFDIYQELMIQFKFDDQVSQEWLINPKRFLQNKSPFEQLSIDADEVTSMLIRMRTGDFS